MKLLKFAMAVLVSAIFANTAMAAEHADADADADAVAGKEKIGVISAQGALSLDGLTQQLSAKADEEGASSFKITSVTGNNKLHGTAEIYK